MGVSLPLVTGVIAAYVVVVIAVGLASRRQAGSSPEEYFLAGRKLGTVVLFMALFGTAAALAIGYIYWNTDVLLAQRLEQTIDAEIQGLAERYRGGDIGQLAVHDQ